MDSDSCRHLLIAPISRRVKSKSFIDYNEQLQRATMDNFEWLWDDSEHNTAQRGEYFAFYFHGIKVVVHKIESIRPPSKRPPNWAENDGQQNRQVLVLSDPLKEIGWNEWQNLNGPQCKQCTFRTDLVFRRTRRPLLYQMLMIIEFEQRLNL
jgi:hypothetical protein